MTTKTEIPIRWRSLAESDPEIAAALGNELHRQNSGMELIASEAMRSSRPPGRS